MSSRRRRGGGVVRVLVLLGIAALIGAGVLAYLLRDQPPETAQRDAPTIKPNLMRTGNIEKNISDKLSQRTGRQVVAECPDEVDPLVGSTFTCDAFYEDDPSTRSVATVKITGGGGQFEWTAKRAPSPEATTPTDGVDTE